MFNNFLMFYKNLKPYNISGTLKKALLKKVWLAFATTRKITKLKSC